MLAGPSAVAFVNGDVVAVAKKLKDASKLYPALVIKGGYMDGAPLDADGRRRSRNSRAARSCCPRSPGC